MRIDDEKERKFYEIESLKYNWSLKELQRQSEDHGKVIELGNENSEISLENTHDQIIQKKGFKIKKQRRINLKSDFENKCNTNWNLSLE